MKGEKFVFVVWSYHYDKEEDVAKLPDAVCSIINSGKRIGNDDVLVA